MVDFPIFDDYDKRVYEWETIEDDGGSMTWQDSLRIFEAVVYRGVVVPEVGDLFSS